MSPQRPPAARNALGVATVLCVVLAWGVSTAAHACFPMWMVAATAGTRETPTENALPGDVAEALLARRLIIPVAGVARGSLRDTFDERRGASRHEALDIAAARGTPVIATGDGRIVKLFLSVPGGRTVYQFDADGAFAYYYAHLDGYVEGLREGLPVKRGDVLGYVGTTGNAPPNAPHLHFAIFRLGPDKHWWQGTAVNPYPYLNDAER